VAAVGSFWRKAGTGAAASDAAALEEAAAGAASGVLGAAPEAFAWDEDGAGEDPVDEDALEEDALEKGAVEEGGLVGDEVAGETAGDGSAAAARFPTGAAVSDDCGWAGSDSVAVSATAFTGCTRAAKVRSSAELGWESAAGVASAVRFTGSEALPDWAAVLGAILDTSSDEAPFQEMGAALSPGSGAGWGTALSEPRSSLGSPEGKENCNGKTAGVVSKVGAAIAIASRLPSFDGCLTVFGRRVVATVELGPGVVSGFANELLPPESSRVAVTSAVTKMAGWDSAWPDESDDEGAEPEG